MNCHHANGSGREVHAHQSPESKQSLDA